MAAPDNLPLAQQYEFGRLLFNARRSIRPAFGAEAMGRAINVSKDTVERWETGKSLPRTDQLSAYCLVLNRKGVSQDVTSGIYDRAYQRSQIARPENRTAPKGTRYPNAGDSASSILDDAMVLPADGESLAGCYLSDPIPDGLRSQIKLRLESGLARRGWRLDRGERGDGCTCPAFNKRLVVDPPLIPLRILKDRWAAYQLYPDILRIFALIEAKKKPGDLFNSPKIRIASDFIDGDRGEVAIQETDYLSSVMTDQIAWSCVRSKKYDSDAITPKEILWDGFSAFLDEDLINQVSYLKSFGDATISNQLGASTIAFSSDGHLMIVGQNHNNRQSVNFLAPSGSGSLDWSDVEGSHATDLLTLVKFGAERELREESALDEDGTGRRNIISRVVVTGFARMLHRGGKPEFFCLGFIEAPSAEIVGRFSERYVESVFPAGVEAADWGYGRPTDSIARVCKSYLQSSFESMPGARVPISYPLEHGLRLLVELCQGDEARMAIDDFIAAR